MVRVYRERLPEQRVPGRGLGRHVHHDPRSRAFPALLADRVVSVRHERYTTVLEQGQVSAGTGYALVGALGCTPLWEPLASFAPALVLDGDLALEAYAAATDLIDRGGVVGHWPPDDVGSSALTVCKVAASMGWTSGYRWAFGLDQVLRAAALAPVLLGVGWYDSFDAPADGGELLVTSSAKVRGGHEVLLTEVDADRCRVWVDNSWGTSWGVDGRAWMSWALLARLLGERGDAVVPVPADCEAPRPVRMPWWSRCAGWLWARSRRSGMC